MNKYNIAGILKTYSEKCVTARDDKHIRKIISDLKDELKAEMGRTHD